MSSTSESTFNSDSELKIFDLINQHLPDTTIIVISHRLSTIKKLDRLVILQKGSIVEEGTYDDLMPLKGTFHALYQNQLIS